MKFRKKPVVIEAVRVEKRMDLTAPDWWAHAVRSHRVLLHGMGKFNRDQPWVDVQTLEALTERERRWVRSVCRGEA